MRSNCFDQVYFLKRKFVLRFYKMRFFYHLLHRVGEPDFVWDHFEKTPQMSTYQLALFISAFESISPTMEIDEMDGRKLQIKVWGPCGHLNDLKDVPDKVVKIMNYLQEYFNSSIILPKLDLVAIPSYCFSTSDSWGLMLFEYVLFHTTFLKDTFIAIKRSTDRDILFHENKKTVHLVQWA